MRTRAHLAWIALAAGCAGAPPAPPPPAAPPPTAAAPTEPVSSLAVDWSADGKTTVLRGVDASGRTRWSINLGRIGTRALADDGGAIVASEGSILRIAPDGAVRCRTGAPEGLRKVLAAGSTFLAAVDGHPSEVRSDASCDVLERIAAADQASARGQGAVLALASGEVVRLATDGRIAFRTRPAPFPLVGDGAPWQGPRVGLFADGTSLVATGDGRVVGLDAGGRTRFELGVAGAPTLVMDGNQACLTTTRGEIAVLSSAGALAFRAQLSRRALSSAARIPGGWVAAADDHALHAVDDAGRLLWDEPLAVGADTTIATQGDTIRATPRFEKTIEVRASAPHVPAARTGVATRYRIERLRLPKGERPVKVAAATDGSTWITMGSPKRWTEPRRAIFRLENGTFHPLAPPPESACLPVDPAPKDRYFETIALLPRPGGQLVLYGGRLGPQFDPNDSPGTPLRGPSCLLQLERGSFSPWRDAFEALRTLPIDVDLGTPTVATDGRVAVCADATCVIASAGAPAVSFEAGPATGYAFVGDALAVVGENTLRVRDRAGATRTFDVPPIGAPKAVGGTSPSDVWVLTDNGIARFDGTAWKRSPRPVDDPLALAVRAPNDAWVTGRDAVAHWDGAAWSRIAGLHGQQFTTIALGADGAVWITSSNDLYRLTPMERDVSWSGDETDAGPAPASIEVAATPEDRWALERVAAVDIAGEPPFRYAYGAARASDGTVWMWDDRRVVQLGERKAELVRRFHRPDTPSCHRCAVPLAAGRGWILDDATLYRAGGAKSAAPDSALGGSSSSIAGTPSGVAGVSANPGAIVGFVRAGDASGWILGPVGSYADIAAAADGDAWLAGAADAVAGPQPVGEGILVHFDGRAWQKHRSADGPLLGVAAPGPREAWAVGANGSFVHAKAGDVRRFHVAGRPLLSSVAVGQQGEVWMVGDDATVLRYDGAALHAFDRPAIGVGGAVMSVIAPDATQPGWVVGPVGIFRVVRR